MPTTKRGNSLAVIPAALALALVGMQTARAQTPAPAAAPAAEAQNDSLQLERVFITGTNTARTKMKQSVSVSTVEGEAVQKSNAASATEVLRAVPGIRSESTGGEGNANIGVRGLPMSDGGARYVQLQQDGLPVLLIGDISFATADQFLRTGFWLDRIDVLRGGSASTASTNSPGAIINFLSKTGREPGGSVGVTLGLGYKEGRFDFDYGARLGEGLYGHIGGFYRTGEGPRPSSATLENGGMLRASITKEFGGWGYVRATFQHLDDKTPTYLPVPVKRVGNALVEYPTVDPRTAFFLSNNSANDVVLNKNGAKITTDPRNGLQVRTDSIGLEGQIKPAEGWTITDRFRWSDITGRFIGLFPADGQPSGYTGTTPVFRAHMFNTALDDMGNVFNDLKVQKEFNFGQGQKLTATGGLFYGKQKVGETWWWNQYNVQLVSTNAAMLSNTGVVTGAPVADATTTWGGCCMRNLDVTVEATAPYLALTWEQGPLSLDGSVRYDSQKYTGTQKFASAATGTWDPTTLTNVNVSSKATSYSFGANYELSRDMALFGRFSHGASWKSPDRVLWDTDVAKGTKPYPTNQIDQFELGLKTRSGGFSGFFTLFAAKTKEGAGYEINCQCMKNDDYSSQGVEAEMAWRSGPFRVSAGATYTHATLDSGSFKGNIPRRQAALIYQITPSYRFGAFELGGAIVGTTKSYAQNDNQVELPAFTVVNLYAGWQVLQNLTVSVGVNNLFNTIGYTEAESQGSTWVARSVNGRTARLSAKYSF